MDGKNLPRHVAIILDGNGRWARSRGLPHGAGHREGAKNILRIVPIARKIGIKVLSLFCFSTENWMRPPGEVLGLMVLLESFLKKYRKKILGEHLGFRWLGRPDGLPAKVVAILRELEEKTKTYNTFCLCLAINYGGRDDVLRALQKLAANPDRDVSQWKWKDVSDNLDTAGLPDVDLLIRTAGERRISNFLLLQSAYAELHFVECPWPDFREQDLQSALEFYGERQRRFGG
ncbi:MAG: di-trans,poly-cis-decaprenylcistransferase [Puniceicoccales bacterium]|nr:di-trans,poly-cis-decaprenylcistransferase [Puniceicoccales bacterium]